MKFSVVGQNIYTLQKEMLVSGSIGEYIAEFDFSPDWDDYTKFAVFGTKDGINYKVALENNSCIIPWEAIKKSGYLRFGCVGINVDKIKPTIFTLTQFIHMGADNGAPEADPSMDIYDQLFSLASIATNIAKSIRDDADSGKFNGIPGPPGPEGPPGASGDSSYIFRQDSPASIWNITHTLQKYPSVSVVDSAGTHVFGEVLYISTSNIQITFKSMFSGKAYLN